MLQTGINTVILSAAAAAAGKLDDPCSHRSKLIFFRSFVLLSGQQIRIKPYHFKLRTEHDCSFSHFVWWRVQLVSSVHRRIWSHQQLLDAGYRLQDFPTYKTIIGNCTENPQQPKYQTRHCPGQLAQDTRCPGVFSISPSLNLTVGKSWDWEWRFYVLGPASSHGWRQARCDGVLYLNVWFWSMIKVTFDPTFTGFRHTFVTTICKWQIYSI